MFNIPKWFQFCSCFSLFPLSFPIVSTSCLASSAMTSIRCFSQVPEIVGVVSQRMKINSGMRPEIACVCVFRWAKANLDIYVDKYMYIYIYQYIYINIYIYINLESIEYMYTYFKHVEIYVYSAMYTAYKYVKNKYIYIYILTEYIIYKHTAKNIYQHIHNKASTHIK